VATLLSFASYGVAFAARPLGAAIFGHFGDKLGRKSILFITLLMMGMATFLIGCLPSFAQVGLLAPVLLVALRIIQGLALGGEWGGAAIMVNELDPAGKRRGLLGAVVQVAAPIGLLLANGAFALVTWLVSEEAFLSWGWRVPFLMSAILVGVGLYIRWNVQESKVFEKDASAHADHAPIMEVLRNYKPQLAIAFFARLGGDIAFYVFTLFLLYYVPTKLACRAASPSMPCCSAPSRRSSSSRSPAGCPIASGGAGADHRRPRRRGLGLCLHADGPEREPGGHHGSFVRRHGAGVVHVLAARLLPARAVRDPGRVTGASLGFQFAGVFGGALAPLIATGLIARFDSVTPVAIYLAIVCTLIAVAAYAARRRRIST
jgi:MFS family permease